MAHPLIRRARSYRATVVAGVVLAMLAVSSVSAGNNGTLKVHQRDSPFESPDNQPKVGCAFDLEGFNLDMGQVGSLILSTQGGDGPGNPDVGPTAFGPANADGYGVVSFSNVPSGHYVAVLYGKGDATDVKAKSKVFKVTCDGGGGGGVG
jgi:hypothetical protein